MPQVTILKLNQWLEVAFEPSLDMCMEVVFVVFQIFSILRNLHERKKNCPYQALQLVQVKANSIHCISVAWKGDTVQKLHLVSCCSSSVRWVTHCSIHSRHQQLREYKAHCKNRHCRLVRPFLDKSRRPSNWKIQFTEQ